jgi:hypothetical protein
MLNGPSIRAARPTDNKLVIYYNILSLFFFFFLLTCPYKKGEMDLK